MNFEFRKYEQKWMPRWLELKCFCDSRGRGPGLHAFLLLAALQIARFLVLYVPYGLSANAHVSWRRVLRTIEFYAAAEKNCFWTSDFHFGMHPATGFQNSTHLRQTRESQKHFGLSHLDIHFCPYFLNSKFI